MKEDETAVKEWLMVAAVVLAIVIVLPWVMIPVLAYMGWVADLLESWGVVTTSAVTHAFVAA